jgi:hypothetical protein
MTEKQELKELLKEIKENQEQLLHKTSRIQKRTVDNSKRLSRIISNSGKAKLKLKNGEGVPTDKAFEVLRWITQQGKDGVQASELGKKYGYDNRTAYKRIKDKLDSLFDKMILVNDPDGKKGHKILNPMVEKYSRKTALMMVKAKSMGSLKCPECGSKVAADAVANKKIQECPKDGCQVNLFEVLEERTPYGQ